MNSKKSCFVTKLFLSLAIMMIVPGPSFGQGAPMKKDYSGAFSFGKASYSYYEHNYERVYDGSFFFEGQTQANMFLYSYTYAKYSLKGDFVNGKRVGKWVVSVTLSGQNSDNDKSVINSIGSYINGEKNGKWVFKVSSFEKGKPISTNEYYVNYKMGKVVNGFSLWGLKGTFDDSSCLTGSWSFKNKRDENLIQFEKGNLQKLIVRDTTTGKVSVNYDIPIVEYNKARNDNRIYEGKLVGNYVEFNKLSPGNSLQIENESLYSNNPNGILITFEKRLDMVFRFIEDIYYPFANSVGEVKPYSSPLALSIKRLNAYEVNSAIQSLEEERNRQIELSRPSRIGISIRQGLIGRYLLKAPAFDKMYETKDVGSILLYVTVNELGKISEFKIQERGTTITNAEHVKFVISTLDSIKFSPREDESTGTIEFRFFR